MCPKPTPHRSMILVAMSSKTQCSDQQNNVRHNSDPKFTCECAIHPKEESQNAECCLELYCCTSFPLGLGHQTGSQQKLASQGRKHMEAWPSNNCSQIQKLPICFIVQKANVCSNYSSFLYSHWRGWTKDEEDLSHRVLQKGKQCEICFQGTK